MSNPSETINLYSHRATSYQRIAPENSTLQQFVAQLMHSSSPPRLQLPVSKFNFFELPSLLDYASSLLNARSAMTLEPFKLRPLTTVGDRFEAYLRELWNGLSATPIQGISLSQEVPNLLTAIQRASRRSAISDSELLRALGVICETVFIGPSTFHLDVTNRCNMDCLFCGLHSPLAPTPPANYPNSWLGRSLPLEVFYPLVDDLADLDSREDILLSGEGEPLLHPASEEMIRYIKNKGLHLLLFTNGLLLTPTTALRLVEEQVDLLYLSVNAGSPETFTALHPNRKPHEFNQIIEQIRHLEQLKATRRVKKPFTTMVLAINALNYKDVKRFAELAVDCGCDSVRYQIMHSCPATEFLLLDGRRLEELRELLEQTKQWAAKREVTILENIDFQLPNIQPNSCDWFKQFMTHKGCLAGWKYSRTFTDGRISFCCHTKIVSDLGSQRFKELWTSDRYNELRVVAKRFDPIKTNVLLASAEHEQPGYLLAPDCAYCGNYEQSRDLYRVIEQAGLVPFLDGTPELPIRKETFIDLYSNTGSDIPAAPAAKPWWRKWL